MRSGVLRRRKNFRNRDLSPKQRGKLSRLEKAKKIIAGQTTQTTGRGHKDATGLLFIGIEPQNVDFITSI